MKLLFMALFVTLFFWACGGGGQGNTTQTQVHPQNMVSSDLKEEGISQQSDASEQIDASEGNNSTVNIDKNTQVEVKDYEEITANFTSESDTCTLAAPYDSFTGKVVGVTDGDTIKVLTRDSSGYHTYPVRLLHIDAPEKGQDFGSASKKALSDMVYGKEVLIRYKTEDRYGRILGEVYLSGLNINQQQVLHGFAWVYRIYCNGRDYLCLEATAREHSLGIWSQPEPVPPWEYRKDKDADGSWFTPIYAVQNAGDLCSLPSDESRPKENVTEEQPYKCGTKRYCKEMESCDEALYFYQVCNVSRLDGDKDGIPCEALCR